MFGGGRGHALRDNDESETERERERDRDWEEETRSEPGDWWGYGEGVFSIDEEDLDAAGGTGVVFFYPLFFISIFILCFVFLF